MTLFGNEFNGSFLETGIVEKIWNDVQQDKEASLMATVKYQFDIEPEKFRRWVTMCENLEHCEYDERLDIASRVKIENLKRRIAELEKEQIKGYCKDCHYFERNNCMYSYFGRRVADDGYCDMFEKKEETKNENED